ncbi:hypothetical protein [Oceanobacillus salinisoli]|uniref:hypothetical protein n=1 Tax=Oceanobacillus salinisoli TaxID=2678611 RepID=UPI0012E18F04|nr:hypothetical protein [Oceanobacillus salinisoli]
MIATDKIISISIIVLSILAGLIAFYIISDLPKEEKRKQMREMTSELVNFVIFIWVGKIIIHFSTFLDDPLALLAYPSDSGAFYVAVLLIGVLLFYKHKRRQMDTGTLFYSFIPVFLVGSFIYEFIQLTWNNNDFSLGYMVVLGVLIIVYLFLKERISKSWLITVMIIGWSLGLVILSFIQPYITIFGYLIDLWFVGVVLITSLYILLLVNIKRVSSCE